MRIAICDDGKRNVEIAAAYIKRWQVENNASSIFIAEYFSSADLLYSIGHSLPFDMVFLDIQFPGELNVLHLAHELRKHNEQMFIVFMANYNETAIEYAIEGYKVNAFRFLQKPLLDIHISECLTNAYKQWMLLNSSSVILETKNSAYRLPAKLILYVESKAHYLYVHSTIHDHEIVLRKQLSDFMEILPANIFIRCHHSYIVNIFHIFCTSPKSITLLNGERIPISDKYWMFAYNSFKAFFRRD